MRLLREKAKIKTSVYVSIILLACFLLPIAPQRMGISVSSPWWTHLSFLFFHAGFIHFLTNAYAFYYFYSTWLFGRCTLPISIFIAILSSFLAVSTAPTVGFSGVVFALIGINAVYYMSTRYFVSVSIVLGTGFLWPSFNSLMHLVCFILGFIAAYLYKHLAPYIDEYRRINS